MAETAEAPVVIEEKKEEIATPVNPFSEDVWKSTPTVKEEAKPIVEEKPKEEPIIEKVAEAKVEEKPKEVQVVPEPIKFANEESEKVHNLLVSGEIDKALDILNEQKRLKEADKLPPADIIKLNLQYQNKDFSSEDINELFSERYAIPDAPERKDDETDEEFESRTEKYNKEVQKVENRIKRDAKPAITELQKLQNEIVLPDIKKEIPEPKAPTQEELDNAKKVEELFFKDLNEGSKNFNSYNATFKDEEVEIKVNYPVTKAEKEALTPLLKNAYDNLPAFFTELGWTEKDGKVTGKLVEDLHLLLNRDKVISKLVSEVGNKRHEASIKAIKNIDYSGKSSGNGDVGETPQQKEKKMVEHFFSA
jgi:hypothetical protein